MGSHASKDIKGLEVRAALDAFRTIVQALRLAAGDGQRRSGLSAAQVFALQQIAEQPGLSINELAARTFTHQSSVSVVVQRLVDRGMVAKVAADDDRRRQTLVLSSKGKRALAHAPAAVQQRLIAAFAALPGNERAIVARALRKIAKRVAPQIAQRRPPMLFEDHPPQSR